MTVLLDLDIMLVILSTLLLLGSSRLVSCIRILSLQGIAVGLLGVLAPGAEGAMAWGITGLTILVKGILLPGLLLRALREADVAREVEPYVGFGTSQLIGILLLAGSFHLSSRLALESMPASAWILPAAFLNLFAGIFLIVSRRKALTQVIGYLVMENGIWTFGAMLAGRQPLLVELGMLLDLLAGVFVMGIALFHIGRTFDHMDADRLRSLRDTPESGEGIP